jgi:molecular chaperone GrpE
MESAMSQQEQNPSMSSSQRGAELEPDVADLVELLRRERANFLNYKRRVEQERTQDRERARADMLVQLLPLLDDLDRALANRPRDLDNHPWAEGLSLIHHSMADLLRDLGVEPIGTVGEPFDPEIHEALFFESNPDSDEKRVGGVVRPGYRLGGRLLRPAQVSVIGPATESGVDDANESRDDGGLNASDSISQQSQLTEPEAPQGG